MADATVAYFDIAKRKCVLQNGGILPITNIFDLCGDEMVEPIDLGDVSRLVAGRGDFWVCVYVDEFEPVTLQ